jgi:hypothetical protein
LDQVLKAASVFEQLKDHLRQIARGPVWRPFRTANNGLMVRSTIAEDVRAKRPSSHRVVTIRRWRLGAMGNASSARCVTPLF